MHSFGWRALTLTMGRTARPGTFTRADWAAYRVAWGYSRSMKSMVHWYRALVQQRKYLQRLPTMRVSVPTLLVWGKQDKFLGWEMAQPSIDLCDQGQLVFLENATHWLQHEEPARVNQLIQEFLDS